MTVLAFPSTVRPVRQQWRLLSNVQLSQSPFNKSPTTYEQPGALWVAVLTFDSLTRAEIADLEAFLYELGGPAGRFTLWDHARESARGAATGTPLVNGAGQTGTSLVTDGWTNSVTGILKKGDYFGVNGELKVMTADANSNGSGQSTLAFRPMLRAAPADNAVITVTKPTAKFLLPDNDQIAFDRRKVVGSITFTCLEDPN